jgi:hypothetical protein
MTRDEMIEAIDGEISRLEQVRDLLEHSTSNKFAAPASGGRGAGASKAEGKAKRVLSPEARKRIAAAQKKRWAKQRRENAAAAEK